MIEASVVCDSISAEGKRLTTFKLRYPRFIHSELMTHRALSRNASSSRAVPTTKLLDEVRTACATPVFWGKNKAGMQAGSELSKDIPCEPGSEVSELEYAMKLWAGAAMDAAAYAEAMYKGGVHKQIVNRILEPYSHINVVATATEWENFFGLRLHKDAQPEIQELARQMFATRAASSPKLLQTGVWHLPFVPADEMEAEYGFPGDKDADRSPLEEAIKVSVARCARVSYESFETGKRSTIEEDLKLCDRLLGAQPLHASPAEHQATPDLLLGHPDNMQWADPQQHGNFVGWKQYRKMLPGEQCAPMPEGYRAER